MRLLYQNIVHHKTVSKHISFVTARKTNIQLNDLSLHRERFARFCSMLAQRKWHLSLTFFNHSTHDYA